MNNHIIKLIAPLFVLILVGCQTQTIRTNEPKDIEHAEKYVEDFFEVIASGDSMAMKNCFGGSIKPHDGLKLIKTTSDILGQWEDVKIDEIKTRVTITNGSAKKEYEYDLTVTYSKGVSIETLRAITVGDTIKVTGYHFEFNPASLH